MFCRTECGKPRISNSLYCPDHTCKIGNCHRYSHGHLCSNHACRVCSSYVPQPGFCSACKCNANNCTKKRKAGSSYCYVHKCKWGEGCNEQGQRHYCFKHKCTFE